MPTIFGILRVKNEARWIDSVIRSILPLCERVFVLDDHSADSTDEICARIDERVTVCRSPFETADESRDKNFLLTRVMNSVSDIHLRGDPCSPYWALAIDGDEELVANDRELIRLAATGPSHVVSLRILYLWDAQDQVRVDGVYGNFRRPSLFRVMNASFRFQTTPWGNGSNLHCASVPQELLHQSVNCAARLLHYGYMHREDRLRKYRWYNERDPDNDSEDRYRHMVQGDLSEVPASARLRWAGPIKLEALCAR